MTVSYEVSLSIECKPIVFEVLAVVLKNDEFKRSLATTLGDVLSQMTADEVERQALRYDVYDVKAVRHFHEAGVSRRVVEE